MFLCLCVFVSVKQFLFCMDRRTDKRKMPDMRCACVSLISLAASSGRHQHAGSRHVELRHPSVGAGDQGGAFRRTLLHGGWHEGRVVLPVVLSPVLLVLKTIIVPPWK